YQPRGHGPVPTPAGRDRRPVQRGVGSADRAWDRPRHGAQLRGHLSDPARGRGQGAGARRPGAIAFARPHPGTRPGRIDSPVNQLYNDPIGHWVVVVVAIALLLFVVLTATAYTVWFERVALGHIQRRPGPNRVGPYGLLQLAAAGVKLAFKESFIPAKTEKVLYVVAPTIAVAAAFLSWAVIPIGLWYNVQYWIADINIGILLIFGLSSLNVYAIFLGGYASENKFSLLGGMRSAAQLISYE